MAAAPSPALGALLGWHWDGAVLCCAALELAVGCEMGLPCGAWFIGMVVLVWVQGNVAQRLGKKQAWRAVTSLQHRKAKL